MVFLVYIERLNFKRMEMDWEGFKQVNCSKMKDKGFLLEFKQIVFLGFWQGEFVSCWSYNELDMCQKEMLNGVIQKNQGFLDLYFGGVCRVGLGRKEFSFVLVNNYFDLNQWKFIVVLSVVFWMFEDVCFFIYL